MDVRRRGSVGRRGRGSGLHGAQSRHRREGQGERQRDWVAEVNRRALGQSAQAVGGVGGLWKSSLWPSVRRLWKDERQRKKSRKKVKKKKKRKGLSASHQKQSC